MSSTVNKDQEQSMEDPKTMTIEFLRARLLAERSVSKTARQRADELAKRVDELEEQLKFVSLQRKKAEMATVDVLAILDDHGINDVSEEFDSSSDQDETLRESNSQDEALRESNSQEEALRESNSHNDMGNEASTNNKVRRNDTEAYSSSESTPSTGRSLSWKSGKDLQYSLEKKKYIEFARRRASFSSNSSTKRIGKSCRRIRNRETRSAIEESQNKETSPLKNPAKNHRQESNGHYFGGDNDMKRALQHQAELIGQYEEEEKAQQEWEEKFRENNSNSYTPVKLHQDSGNHSDVTEEQDEIKAPEISSHQHLDTAENPDETKVPEPPFTSSSETSSGNPEMKSEPVNESSGHEFSHPMSTGNPEMYVSSRSSPSRDLAVISRESFTNVGSVLEKLQQARLSLKQNLNSSPVVPYNPENTTVGKFSIPAAYPALFRLPTDNEFEALDRANRFGSTQLRIADERYSSNPFTEPTSAVVGDRFHSVPPRSFSDIRPGVSMRGPPSSNGLNFQNPSLSNDFYPFLPDYTLRLPPSEGTSRTFLSSDLGVRPVPRFDSHQPNMYR